MKRHQTQHPNRDHYRKESYMPTSLQRILGLAFVLSLAINVQAAEPPDLSALVMPA